MTKTIRFRLNGKPTTLETDGERTLLWVLRADLGLTGHEVRLRRGDLRGLHGAGRTARRCAPAACRCRRSTAPR